MRVHIDKDEWWPVFSVTSEGYDWQPQVEMSPEDVERFQRVEAEFTACQAELGKLHDAAEEDR